MPAGLLVPEHAREEVFLSTSDTLSRLPPAMQPGTIARHETQ
jgi:hypothetical protein